MNNQKILLVSHQFLPHLSPRTTRWKTLVDKLIEMGNEVTILTGSPPDETVKNYNILYFGNKKMSTTMNLIRKDANNLETMIKMTKSFSKREKIIKSGEKMVITAGLPLKKLGTTNLIRVVKVD